MAESVVTQDASGAVAIANTFQQVLAAKAARRLLIVQGVSAAILVDFGSSPSASTALALVAGQAMILDMVCPREAVWITSTTGGATYVVKEGT